MNLLPKWPIKVEVIEERQGGEYTWFTKAREVSIKPSNTVEYQIQGFRNKMRAPKYKHLSRVKNGDFMRIFVPAEGDAYILEVTQKTVPVQEIEEYEEDGVKKQRIITVERELRPVFDEGDREWQDHQLKKTHEDWQIKSFLDKWLVFIMVVVVALIFIVGTYLNTEGQVKIAASAAGVAGSNERTAASIAGIDERWGRLIDRIDKLLLKYGIDEASLNLTNITIDRPPA